MSDQYPQQQPEPGQAQGQPDPAQQPPAAQPPAQPPAQQPPAYGQGPQSGQGSQWGQQSPTGEQPGGYQQFPGAAAPAGGYSNELSPADQRMWAMLAHLGGILFLVIAPLIVFLVQKDRGQYVREQSREALNFNITLLIGYVIGGILTLAVIGGVMIFALAILNIVFPILAGLAANRGENYRYPFALRLVS